MSPRSRYQRTPFYLVHLLMLSILLLSIARTAEVGYGPLYDPCGDNCQTQLVSFCTVGHDTAQMEACWCDDPEYVIRMDACLDSCDPDVSNKTIQRDQMLQYRSIVCDPTVLAKNVVFQEYYKTRFASVAGGSFTPGVTRGIPPPTASAVEISISTGGITSEPVSSIRPTSSRPSEFSNHLTVFVTPTPTTITLPSNTPSLARLRANGLSTKQIVGIVLGTAVASVLLSLTLVFFIRRRHPQRPFWNPPPPPPLPRRSPSSFLPYYTPTSPPPTMIPQHASEMTMGPHGITTSTASIHTTSDKDGNVISPTRGRGGYSYFPQDSPALPTPQSYFYTRPGSVSTRMLTPVVTPTTSMIQVTSSSAIAAAAAAERNSRGSTHTIIEPEPQQAILQGAMVDTSQGRSRSWGSSGGQSQSGDGGRSERRTRFESGCVEDDCTSCSSISERGWYDEEDDSWWDLRESQVMGP